MLKNILCVFIGLTLLSGCATKPKDPVKAESVDLSYQYPIQNPYAATIIGVPAELKHVDTESPKFDEEILTVFKDRKIPEGFWYEKGLRYGQLLQKRDAPLIYILAGTGADHRSGSMVNLGTAFYRAGFHVVLLPSSTHSNFIISASENYVPGRSKQAAKDLYRVMKMIDARISKETKITDHYLMGYSLGATDAAFTARLDEDQKALNFKKVLLINPPYNLYSSIKRIDTMLYAGLPNGIDGVDAFIDKAMARLASASPTGDPLDFQNERLLIDAYTKYPPSDESLATMIGLAFRLFAANMMFTSDVMTHDGYIFPKNVEYTTGTSLNNYMTVALRTSFMNYFEDVYTKAYLRSDPTLTKETLIEESSLSYLAPYLTNNSKIGLITNKDDFILAPGELDKLKAIFGSNATIFPNGGHLGNLSYPPVTHTIVQFMTSGGQQ